jgi:SAM-dependent methyltransferase
MKDGMADALRAWAEQLAGWAIPEHILAAAEESPWVVPHAVFVRRADRRIGRPSGASHAATVEALTRPGTVLDVGAGAGAASLPVATTHPAAITEVTAIDTDAGLLDAFAGRAASLGLAYRTINGRWPGARDDAGPHDVVVCGHVLYNAPDLEPFVAALTGSARRRVVVETAEVHPLTSLNPLWRRFHGLDRPEGPTADDAIAALRELGIEPRVTRWAKRAVPEYERFDELVEVSRKRLCLPPDAAAEVARALRDLQVDTGTPPDLGSSGREVVTLSWPGSSTE